MNKTFIGVIIVVAVLLIGFFVVKNYKTPAGMPTGAVNPTESTVPNTILIKNFSFEPNAMTVSAGTTVTWVNQDSVTHNIKSTDFTSPDLPQGATYEHAFMTKGTFTYNCGIHPTMVGTVIVE